MNLGLLEKEINKIESKFGFCFTKLKHLDT